VQSESSVINDPRQEKLSTLATALSSTQILQCCLSVASVFVLSRLICISPFGLLGLHYYPNLATATLLSWRSVQCRLYILCLKEFSLLCVTLLCIIQDSRVKSLTHNHLRDNINKYFSYIFDVVPATRTFVSCFLYNAGRTRCVGYFMSSMVNHVVPSRKL